ncbi:MAG: hypothetical protein ABIK09_04300 [Pseudomonadota bacterium]
MRFPFDYLDTICLAATSREHGISSAPVWQLHVDGDLDEDITGRALTALTRRYPILVSRAVPVKDGRSLDASRRIAYEVDPAPRLDDLFRVVDLTGDDARFPAVQQEVFDHHIDMSKEYPARITWVRRSSSRGVLMFQQHHGIADGRAFWRCLEDFCGFYDQAAEGKLPAEIEPIQRIPEALVAEPSALRRFGARFVGTFLHLRNILRYSAWPPDQLVSNLPGDYTGHNQVHHRWMGPEEFSRIGALRGAAGVSTNDVLSSALALALASWSGDHGHPVRRFNLLIPTDVRPRPWTLESFANHLSSFLVDLHMDRYDGPLDLLDSVRGQIRRQARRRDHITKVLAEILVARLMPLGRIRDAVFAPKRTMLNFPFSNLVAISPSDNEGRLGTRHWIGEDLRIMTPCAWLQGVNTTVIRYGGRLCFNFNHKASVIDTPMVSGLADRYEATLTHLVTAVHRRGQGT